MRYLVIVLIALSGCGGGGGGNSAPSDQLEPVTVSITKSSTGCLVSHNADAVAVYQLGTHQARTLLWSCANMPGLLRRRIDTLFTFDDARQCFIEQGSASKSGDCTSRAIAPENPTLSVSIRAIDPALVPIGGGSYALQPLDVELTNTGNLTAFITPVYFSSLPLFLNPGETAITVMPEVFPGEKSLQILHPIVSHQPVAGDVYSFELTAKDIFGNVVGSTVFDLVAP
jgi:hypothetical protein